MGTQNRIALDVGGPVTLVYTPSHLYHILFELYKNAMRAVVELHGDGSDIPPIKTVIVKSHEDVTIKVHPFNDLIKTLITRSPYHNIDKEMYFSLIYL